MQRGSITAPCVRSCSCTLIPEVHTLVQVPRVVVSGDPSTTIADIRKVETVFKKGVGFDPAKLIASVKGQVGIW